MRRRGTSAAREPVPGYGHREEWIRAGGRETDAGVPRGWSDDNLRRVCRLDPVERAIAHVGVAAASHHTPCVLGTRVGARFLERVFFDDVKLDFRVWDQDSRQVVDLWMLVAMDYASGAFLGFWMRPASEDYKGREQHLRQQDMVLFAGWLLETYGLPTDYQVEWKVENGTATFNHACAEAIGDFFGHRLTVSYARMIGGKSPVGYRETADGNSRAKAPLESAFNLLHNGAADMPGQTGRRYDVRPADLPSREKETKDIEAAFAAESQDIRALVRRPVLTVDEARRVVNHIFARCNTRTDHDLEGFTDMLEWRMAPAGELPGNWQPIASLPHPAPESAQIRQRKQTPLERILELHAATRWERVPGSALAIFYSTSQRLVEVNAAGEVTFDFARREYTFRPPAPEFGLPAGTRLLAYFAPHEPRFVHLMRRAPHCGYVGTWARRERIGIHDQDGLAREMEYTQSALKAARTTVAALQSGDRRQLDDIRAHNADLLAEAHARREAIDATVTPLELDDPGSVPASPAAAAVAHATRSLAASARMSKARAAEAEDLADLADAALSASWNRR